MQKEIVMEVSALKKYYAKRTKEFVLKGVDFKVYKGQIFSLLGSNGAGKTTAVKTLATLLKPTEGKVTICGYNLSKDAKRIRRCISLTGQYAAVDENLSGRENLHLIGRLKHVKDYKEKAEEYLTLFELQSAANRRVKTYSGGMKRKLDIAMSLLGDPQIIFLDEPTTGLDPQSRRKLWDIIENLAHEKGITIFLTTQYLDEAERLADYIAVLEGGVIVAGGTLDELKRMMPDWKPVMVESAPSLEEVFLSLVNKPQNEEKRRA